MKRYLIIVEQPQNDEENYGAYCPDLPGCIATGETEAEVIDLMAEAVEFHLEGLVEEGEALPPSTVRAVELAVRVPNLSAG